MVTYVFEWGKLLQSQLMAKLAGRFRPGGYKHVYDHYLQTSFSLKLFGELKPNCIWNLHANGGHTFIKTRIAAMPK